MSDREEKRGRTSKYPEIDLRQVEALGQYGLTQEEIAHVLGIAVSTLYEYKKEHPEFSEAIKRGLVRADAKVIQSLYNRAVGRRVITRQTKKGLVEEVHQIDPDTTACIFWTKNRQRDRWKDKHEFEGSFRGGGPVIFMMPRPGRKAKGKAK